MKTNVQFASQSSKLVKSAWDYSGWKNRRWFMRSSRTISQELFGMELKRRLDSLQKIILMGESLLTTFDIEELLNGLVLSVCKLLDAEGATLYLVDPIENKLVSQSIKSERVKEISLNIDNSSIAGYTAINRRSMNIKDAYADLTGFHPDLVFNKEIDQKTGKKTRNIITQPLVIQDDLIGVLQVVNKISGNFDEDDQLLLKNFSITASVAIMNAKLMEGVMEAQTGAFNVIENISDRVIVQDIWGHILHLNAQAAISLPDGMLTEDAVGRSFVEVFPELEAIQPEIKKVIEQNLDKSFSGGQVPYVILTSKNFRQEIERIILILKTEHKATSDPANYPID